MALDQPEPKAEPEGDKPPKIVKRYSNRKLYDTERSKYVTLEEIARMIKEGEDINIIDNKSGRDLTAVTLAQIIYEEEKQKSRMPLSMLRKLIQSSGDALQDFWDRSVITPVSEMRDSAQKGVEEIKAGAQTLKEVASRGVAEFGEAARTVFKRTGSMAATKRVDLAVRRFDQTFSDLKEQMRTDLEQHPDEAVAMLDSVEKHVRARVDELQELHNPGAKDE